MEKQVKDLVTTINLKGFSFHQIILLQAQMKVQKYSRKVVIS